MNIIKFKAHCSVTVNYLTRFIYGCYYHVKILHLYNWLIWRLRGLLLACTADN